MSDIHESLGDTGYEAHEAGPDIRYPDDATSTALVPGFHQINVPSEADKDQGALAERPEPARMQLDWKPPENLTLRDVAQHLVDNGLMMKDFALIPINQTEDVEGEDIRVPKQSVADMDLPMVAMGRSNGDVLASDEVEDKPKEIELDPEARDRLRPEVVREADVLCNTFSLVRGTSVSDDDDYFKDATGNVQSILTINTKRNASISDDARVGSLRRSTIELTQHAVKTGKEEAARYAFGNLPDSDKWLVYADAYESANGNPQMLADWRHELDTAYERGAEAQSEATQVSRLFALTKGKLHDYSSTIDPERLASLRAQQGLPEQGSGNGPTLDELGAAREEHKQMAIEYGTRLGEMLKAMQSRNTSTTEFLSRTWSPDKFEDEGTIAFARAGVWEGAAALNARHTDKYVHELVQTIKAVHGQLGRVERQQLRFSGDTGKLLRWLDDPQSAKGDVPSAANISVHTRMLLEKVVPDRLQHLDLGLTSADRSLRMALASGDYESVRAHYAATLDRHNPYENLRAALMVSQHLHDVQATEAAHEVYEEAFLNDLTPVEAKVDTLFIPGFDGDVGDEVGQELERLHAESSQLKDPVTSLHAKARLANMFLKIEPDSKRTAELMSDINTQWSVLERREGGDQELSRLYKSLRSAGFHVEPQWKREGAGGFIGFRPTSEQLVRRSPSTYNPFSGGRNVYSTGGGDHVYIEMADEMLRTASTLNELLGTERYRVEIDEDDMRTVEALRAHNAQRTSPLDLFPHQSTRHTVELVGPWRVLYSTEADGCAEEFEKAAGNIRSVDRGFTMHSNTALTDHLRQLIDEAEEEWQKEHAAAV